MLHGRWHSLCCPYERSFVSDRGLLGVAGGSTRVRPVLDHRLSRPPGFWGAGLWFAKLNNTRAFQKDDWRWVAAAEDQGLFW